MDGLFGKLRLSPVGRLGLAGANDLPTPPAGYIILLDVFGYPLTDILGNYMIGLA